MHEIQGIKIKGKRVLLIQALCVPPTYTLIKAVFLGVKEEIKAVCADILARKSILLESTVHPCLYPEYGQWPKILIRRIAPYGYDLGEVYYQQPLEEVIWGNRETIMLQIYDLFQKKYGASIPLLKEFSGILWDIASTNGYTQEIIGIGLPAGEKVYTLKFPELGEFEGHLLKMMPQIYALARTLVRDDVHRLDIAA